MQVDMALEAGAQDEVRFMIGACDAAPMIESLTAKYLTGSLEADVHFDALIEAETALSQNLQVKTPDEVLNNMVNVWSPKQIDYGVVWTRWGFKGYRDIIQQCQGAGDPAITSGARAAAQGLRAPI